MGSPFCIGTRRELFVDDTLIGRMAGAELSALIGKLVRFRSVLKDADIFALQTK